MTQNKHANKGNAFSAVARRSGNALLQSRGSQNIVNDRANLHKLTGKIKEIIKGTTK